MPRFRGARRLRVIGRLDYLMVFRNSSTNRLNVAARSQERPEHASAARPDGHNRRKGPPGRTSLDRDEVPRPLEVGNVRDGEDLSQSVTRKRT